MPVIIAGNDQQKKKYLGRMTEQPMMCVSMFFRVLSLFPSEWVRSSAVPSARVLLDRMPKTEVSRHVRRWTVKGVS